MRCWLRILVGTAFCGVGLLTARAGILDGDITAGDGYTWLTESSYAQPITGGQPGSSDLLGETATYHRWDGFAGADVNIGGMDDGRGRGDLQNLFVGADADYLYLGVEGGSAPLQNWNGPDGSSSNEDGDQGDLIIAVDASGDLPGGGESLAANDAHRTFQNPADPYAVDFLGWAPTHFVGLDYADNDNGNNTPFGNNNGYANIEEAGTHNVTAGEGHNVNDGGFEWVATYDGTAQGFATYEFRIPWIDLGWASAPAAGTPFQVAAYMVANLDFHDTYDSAPGQGQVSNFEEIGDFPGDLDTGSGDDGLEAGEAPLNGVPAGSFPGSNYVDPNFNNYSSAGNRNDEIDTIEEYMSWAIPPIPEPNALGLVLLGLAGLALRRRRG